MLNTIMEKRVAVVFADLNNLRELSLQEGKFDLLYAVFIPALSRMILDFMEDGWGKENPGEIIGEKVEAIGMICHEYDVMVVRVLDRNFYNDFVYEPFSEICWGVEIKYGLRIEVPMIYENLVGAENSDVETGAEVINIWKE